MIEFKKFQDNLKPDWVSIYKNSENSTFLLSLEWINFQKKIGKQVEKYIIYDNDKPIGIFYIENWRRRISKYAYCPRGPVLIDEYINDPKLFTGVIRSLKSFGKKYIRENGLTCFRIDPLIEIGNQESLIKQGWKESLTLGQVKNTWIMDLSSDKDKLFELQKKDTRYYIRRAEKSGVEIIRATSQKEVEEFNRLMKETKIRNNFNGFGSEYYNKQWNSLNSNGDDSLVESGASLCEIFLARYNGKYISCALINFSNQTAHYAHGGSTSDPELMKLASPYLLLWKAIEFSKEKGMAHFDFWGVIPKGVSHEWRGLSDFKMKFTGEFIRYTGIFEVYNNFFKYTFNRIIDWWNYRKLRF